MRHRALAYALALVTLGCGSGSAPQLGPGAALAVGNRHVAAIRSDLTVWGWGQNSSGQLGNATQLDATAPVRVTGLAGIRGVAAGHQHTLVLRADGTVAAVGGNAHGQLGNGATEDSLAFVEVSGLTGVKTLAAKGHHSYAVKEDGTVWAWGYAALGEGQSRSSPARLAPEILDSVTTVASGLFHAAAIKSDGTLWMWGSNRNGELGIGASGSAVDVPQQVKGPGASGFLTGVVDVACGYQHTLAVREDGTVWAWGANASGQLGDGTLEARAAPVQVPGLGGARFVAAGFGHSVAVLADGQVYTWGLNDVGQLGNGELGTDAAGDPLYRASPGLVPGLQTVSAVASGSQHTVALLADGSFHAWGENASGQLGDGTLVDSPTVHDVSKFTR